MFQSGPCGDANLPMQMLNAVLNACNVALVAWLAQRRLAADRRENGRYLRPQWSDRPGKSECEDQNSDPSKEGEQ